MTVRVARVRIGPTIIRYENGTEEAVPAFCVQPKAVTVGEYTLFEQESGYVTAQERRDESATFRSNSALEGLAPRAAQSRPAMCLAYQDILAYCDWAGGRLPTESEWLAFAVASWSRTLDMASWRKYVKWRMTKDSGVRLYGAEWTSSPGAREGSKRIRIRPFYALHEGWESTPDRNYGEAPEDGGYHFRVFRTVSSDLKLCSTSL